MQAPSERARHDPPLAQAAIVRPAFRNRPVPGLDVEVKFGGGTIRVQGPYYLLPLDQSVLLAVLARARRSGCPTAEGEPVDPEGAADGAGHWTVRTTISALGMDIYGASPQGRSYGDIRDALDRLGAITVRARQGTQWARSWLLAVAGDDVTGEVVVTLSWRLARALAGQQWITLDLTERRALASDPARILHAYFSASLQPGKSWSYYLETLACRVWGEPPTSPSTQRKRRQRVREALRQIHELGNWTVTRQEGSGAIRIHRRARGHGRTG